MEKQELIVEKIKEMFQSFSFEGAVGIFENSGLIINEKTNNTQTFFPVHKFCNAFVHLLLLLTLDKFNIDVNEYIANYLSELQKGSKITFLNILKDETGLIDIHGHLANIYRNQPFYLALSDKEKEDYDLNFRYSRISNKEIIHLYNECDWDHLPGSVFDFSPVAQNLGVVLLEKIWGQPYESLLTELVLKPVGIKPKKIKDDSFIYKNKYPNIKSETRIDNPDLFLSLTLQEAGTIYQFITNGSAINKKTLKLMQKLTPFQGISYTESYSAAHHFVMGPFHIYDFKDIDAVIINAVEFEGYEIEINGELRTFYNYFLPQLMPFFISYKKPKLVKLNKHNVYDLLYLENDPAQLWFMGQTKYMLAYQYVEKHVTCYLLIDNGVAVGTISLYIDKKGNKYDISNVLVDKKYQGRGYGKALIKEALKKFNKAKVKSLTMFVEKANQRAINTYLSSGFVIKNAYPKSFELEYWF